MIVGIVAMWLIAAALIAAGAWMRVDTATAAYLIGVPALLLSTTHIMTRRQFRRDGESPTALLDGLERRHAARLRTMRWMPWLTGVVVLAAIALVSGQMIAARHFDLTSALVMVACCIVTAAYTRFVIKRVGAKIANDLADVAHAREQLVHCRTQP
jgi:hypothetical protein